MTWHDDWNRFHKLRLVVSFLLFVLFAKALFSIVIEYRSYFPPNFDSAFLIGRQEYFAGIYATAFYAHIIAGPVSLLLGLVLLLSGGRSRFRRTHRWMGRIQILTIVAVLAPSGLVMATHAYTGAIAGWGFALHSIATAACALMTFYYARARKFALHRMWAIRCYILLCSPLLLRLMSGAVIVLDVESHLTYRVSAWTSWIMPMLIFELWNRSTNRVSLARKQTFSYLRKDLI